ncbi:hypothetical protein SESI111939_10030 [Serratia silvae]
MVVEREYFVISVGHTQRSSPYILLWAANNSGYRGRLETAGRYTESQIRKQLDYYNNGCDTVAVPCDVAEPLSIPVALSHASHFSALIMRLKTNTRHEQKVM